ncbi:uncharacterized protein [Mytilus edulis]|uniref:uncharacterized protein isoform X2 n=1 Tax=Mytilus edulis TaxID=6550 RepID=UPI0039F0CB95
MDTTEQDIIEDPSFEEEMTETEESDIIQTATKVDGHSEKLLGMCRICGTNDLQHGTKRKDFFRTEMMELFQIDISLDDPHVHPDAICRYHEKMLLRFAKSQTERTVFRTSVEPVKFTPHLVEGNCSICSPINKRKRKRRGTLKSLVKEYSCTEEVADNHSQHISSVHAPLQLQLNDNNIEPIHVAHTKSDQVLILPYANEITLSVHAEETAETAQDVIKSFNRLNQEEKSNFISKFPKVLSEFELTKLTYEIGKNQNEYILKDCDCISKHYTSREILQALSPVEWLSKRNKVLFNFMTGLAGNSFDFIDQINSTDAFLYCRAMEYLYNLRNRKLVAPFAFLVSLDMYTKTSSRVAIDALGKSSPGGSYKTLKHWLSTYAETVPKCPDGTLITGFDNEQVVGYKRGLGEGSKSLTSVITTIVNTTMHDKENSNVQLNENFKPKNWFSVNHFIEKLKNASSNETNSERVKRIKTDKEYFIKEVSQIRDSSLPLFTTLEKIHYDQMYFFLSKAIKDVLNEQENANDEIIDYVDKQAHQESRQKNIIVCTRCGTENPKRKQICENCQEREGIKEAKQAQQRTKKCDDVSKSVGSKEISLNTPLETATAISGHQRFEHVPSNHKESTKLMMGRPVFLNPNSNEAVALILRSIGISSGIKRYEGNNRHWTFVCCDGRPHSLYQKLLTESVICSYCNQAFLNRKAYKDHHKLKHQGKSSTFSLEFDWLYMRIGLGHFEMNVIKSFFELNWTPFLEKMCEIMQFTSDNAKNFAKTCKDHHVAWQLLLVFHTTSLKEMVVPFVRYMMKQGEMPTPDKYLLFYKEFMSSNPRWAYLHLQVFRFSQAIINLRMGVRRNNSCLVQSAKFHLKELFYGRSHPHYRDIELFDTLQYHFMPDEVKNIWDNNTAFTVSGHNSKGQDLDFLLEEKNRAVKQFIPSGSIPSNETWDAICCNLQYIEDLQNLVSSWVGTHRSNNYQTKHVDIEFAVNSFRQTLRTYLKPENETFCGLSGSKLHPGLLKFLETSTLKRMDHINTEVLNEEPNLIVNQNEPVYVSDEEIASHMNKLSKIDIIRKTEHLIHDELKDNILRSHYENVLHSIDGGQLKKDVYLTLYYEIKDVIQSECNIGEDESVDFGTLL